MSDIDFAARAKRVYALSEQRAMEGAITGDEHTAGTALLATVVFSTDAEFEKIVSGDFADDADFNTTLETLFLRIDPDIMEK